MSILPFRQAQNGRNPFGLRLAAAILAVLTFPISAPAEPPIVAPTQDASATPAPEAEPAMADPSITLRGSVWRTKAGIVFLKTPIGILTLSSKTTLKDVKASHEVHFWVHNHNSVVDIRKKVDGSLVHRYLTGPMTLGAEIPKTLLWWTPEGEQTTHYGTQEERLGTYREGDRLTVEVDQSHTIIGVHDLQYDLQVSQAPPAGSEVRLFMSGTVSKLKSNFIFFRTPVGVVMVNSKIGVPRVKVGQPMTLHIDGPQVSVDLSNSGSKPAPEAPAP